MRTLGIEVTEKQKTFTSLLLIPVLMLTLGAFTCNIQSVVSRINSIVTELAPAIQLIVSLLPLFGAKIPSNVSQEVGVWAPKVEADITLLGNTIQQYQNDISNNPTAAAAINAVLQTTENDVLSILPVFNVLDQNTQQKVVALVNAVAAAVISVENIVNAAQGKSSAKAAAFQVSSGKDFKSKFNTVLHAPTGDSVIDGATASKKGI